MSNINCPKCNVEFKFISVLKRHLKISSRCKSLEEEIKINETTRCRIIGITIETRPDYVTKKSIRDYRRWGVTRVQLGVQHYNDDILRKINRECYTKDTIRAIKMLKDCAFKVVCHLMPDLQLIIISLCEDGVEVSLMTLGGFGRDFALRIAGADIKMPLAFSAAGK